MPGVSFVCCDMPSASFPGAFLVVLAQHERGRPGGQCKACGHQGYSQATAVEIARQHTQAARQLLERIRCIAAARATDVVRKGRQLLLSGAGACPRQWGLH